MGLAYYLRSKKLLRVGILAPNTPAFLASVYGIGGAGGVNVGEYALNLPVIDPICPDNPSNQLPPES